ncbi:sulfite exporter TauE/SafE family protein [Marinomonas agarivorans]|nr:sulfite exporter TauE/SafE family protein [Marinomonas agarivorans]
MDISLFSVTLLIGTGFIAGIINTLAGGGSNLTLPALMIMGLPADIANSTNRVAVFMQAIVAISGFKKADKIESNDILPVVLPTLVGGVIGSLFASHLPAELLKPLLLVAMLSMTFIMLVKPNAIAPASDAKTYKIQEKPIAIVTLFIAGLYGGFVQAGVGFILIAAIAGTLRYDLIRTNALKMICTLGFTSLSLFIFIWQDQILWIAGLVLGIGSMLGSYVAVKFALKAQPSTLKWFLFIMTLFGSAAALLL